jgi:hypothetical protein
MDLIHRQAHFEHTLNPACEGAQRLEHFHPHEWTPFLFEISTSSLDYTSELQHSKPKQSEHEQQISSQGEEADAHGSGHLHRSEMFRVNLLFRLVVERMHDGKEPTLFLRHLIEFSGQCH